MAKGAAARAAGTAKKAAKAQKDAAKAKGKITDVFIRHVSSDICETAEVVPKITTQPCNREC